MSSTAKITLETPIQRGETEITEITLHRPKSGALRETSLRALLDMECASITRVLPRISDPKLTESEVANLDLPDLLKAGAAIAGFLLPKAALETEDSNQPQ